MRLFYFWSNELSVVNLPASILALDPGVVTGAVYVTLADMQGDVIVIESRELSFSGTLELVAQILAGNDRVVVVAEKFTITSQTGKKSPQPASLEVIGATRALLWSRGRDPEDLLLQTPAAAKSMVSNDMIRDAGMWHRGGAGHANDAARHAMLYLLQRGWRPQSVLDPLLGTSETPTS